MKVVDIPVVDILQLVDLLQLESFELNIPLKIYEFSYGIAQIQFFDSLVRLYAS